MNLIICTTPLHSLIAEKIIENRAGELLMIISILIDYQISLIMQIFFVCTIKIEWNI